jgi:hypothetical protein
MGSGAKYKVTEDIRILFIWRLSLLLACQNPEPLCKQLQNMIFFNVKIAKIELIS